MEGSRRIEARRRAADIMLLQWRAGSVRQISSRYGDIHLASARIPWRWTAAGCARPAIARPLVNAVDCKQDQEIRAEWNEAGDAI